MTTILDASQLEKQIFLIMEQIGSEHQRTYTGLADGYFVLPYTIGDYLSADIRTGPISTDTKEFEEAQKSVEEKIKKIIIHKRK